MAEGCRGWGFIETPRLDGGGRGLLRRGSTAHARTGGVYGGVPSGRAQVRIESTATIEEIHVTGNFAHLANHLTVTMTPLQGGPIIRRSGYTLTIMRKEPDGRWVLYRDANMLAADA